MSQKSEQELMNAVKESDIEWGKLVDFSATIGELFVTVAQLQLAFRHPQNQGASAIICRGVAKRMIGEIALHIDNSQALISLLNLDDDFPGMETHEND